MAKKTPKSQIKVAHLKISKQEFEDELKKCLADADSILAIKVSPISRTSNLPYGYGRHLQRIDYNETELNFLIKEVNSWVEYVSELLKQSFDIPNNDYHRDFVTAGQAFFITGNEDMVNEYKDEVRKKSEYIESLIKRLKLIPSLVDESNTQLASQTKKESNRIFIVHGHDDAKRTEAEMMVKNLGYQPVVLFKEPNQGATIIEKLEKEIRDIAFAIVLYTKCDEGKAVEDSELRPRARQNVVFEHGMMCGVLGRHRVVALVEDGVEIPGDLSGFIYIEIDAKGAWKYSLADEMKSAGLMIDKNKI